MTRALPDWKPKNDDAPIPDRVKERVARKADNRCQTCTLEIGGKLRAEFDHAIPLILGGLHAESNLQLLCHICHGAKTVRDVKIKAKVARNRKKNVLGLKKRTGFKGWRKMNGDPVYAERER